MKIDDFTPLPTGLVFANNHITGSLEKTCNKFVHVLVDLTLEGQSSKTTVGKSFELIVVAKMPEVKLKQNGCAGGCSGTLGTIAITSLLGVALAGVLGVRALRKKNED